MVAVTQISYLDIIETPLAFQGMGNLYTRMLKLSCYVNTFTAKGFSETSPAMYLNKHIFRSQ